MPKLVALIVPELFSVDPEASVRMPILALIVPRLSSVEAAPVLRRPVLLLPVAVMFAWLVAVPPALSMMPAAFPAVIVP